MAHSGERESVAQTVRRKRLVTKGRNMFTVNVRLAHQKAGSAKVRPKQASERCSDAAR